jgi:hypothetical protein
MTRQIVTSTGPTVYFDNCLIGALVKGEFPAEIAALGALMREHAAGRLVIVTSTEAKGEIERLPAEYRGLHLDVYQQFKQLPGAKVPWIDAGATIESTDPDYQKARHILRDEIDRRHVVHAVKYGIGYFATVDQRTILNQKGPLEAAFTVTFGTPTEIARKLNLTMASQ